MFLWETGSLVHPQQKAWSGDSLRWGGYPQPARGRRTWSEGLPFSYRRAFVLDMVTSSVASRETAQNALENEEWGAALWMHPSLGGRKDKDESAISPTGEQLDLDYLQETGPKRLVVD
jgi:hypothetical protein